MSTKKLSLSESSHVNVPPRAMEEPTKRDAYTFDWSKSASCFACGCFSFILQVVLVASMVSLVFGWNISASNTSINHISWEYENCDFRSKGVEVLGCTKDTNFQAFISTAVFAGATIGSLFSGAFLSFGRRTMLIISLLVFGFGTVCAICANSFSALVWARLNGGLGVGLSSVAVPAYMSEMTPPSVRGRFGVFHQTFINLGILFATVIGLPIGLTNPVPEGPGPHDSIDGFSQVWWRVMFGIALLPIIIDFYLLFRVFKFETPHYYIGKGHLADAEMLVKLILQKDDVSDELRKIMDEIDSAKKAQENGMSLSKALKRADYRWVIVFSCILSAFQQLSGINVFMANSSNLFKDAGMSGDLAVVMTVVMCLLNLCSTLCAVPVIEKFGRRPLMVIGTIMQTVGLLPAAICYWILKDDSDVTLWLAIIGSFIFIIAFGATYGPVLWVYLYEVFPLEIQGSAAGAATALNWACGVLLVFIGNYLDNNILFTIFTVMAAIGAVNVIFFMLETKGRVLGDSPYINRNAYQVVE